jgi:F1F0 ATPase subunit 2
MTMLNDPRLVNFTTSLALPLLVGMGLGLFYFGGLWWTVQQLTTARRPASLSLGSMLVRLIGTQAGFFWIMDGQWERLIACVIGFFAARTLLVSHFSPIRDKY